MVFFKGVSPGLRKDVWPVILKVYGSNSTDKERKQLKQDLMEQYQELSRRRLVFILGCLNLTIVVNPQRACARGLQ